MKNLLLALICGVSFTMSFADDYPILAGEAHALNSPKYIEVYAHRGARSYSPENTLPAYKTGLALGTHWVDMDIGITRDGFILINHDLWLNPDILRKDGQFWATSKQALYQQLESSPAGLDNSIQPYLIKNLTLAQLQSYAAGRLNPQSAYAKYFPAQFPVDGIVMPTLQEIVSYVDKLSDKHVQFQIEVKNDPRHPEWTVSPQRFAADLAAFLRKNKLTQRVEIQSFDWAVLYELQRLDSQVKTAYLVGYDDVIRMQSSDIQQAGLWSGGKLLKDYNNSIPQMIKALGGSCYEPEDAVLTKEDLDEAHRLGLKVVVWGWPEHSGRAFDPQLMSKLIDWGVDGIISDDPAQLNAMLAARGLPVAKRYTE